MGQYKHVASAHRLGFAGVHRVCTGNQSLAHCWANVVDFEFRRHDRYTQRCAARVGQSVICGVADNAPMNKAMLLAYLIGHRDLQLALSTRVRVVSSAPISTLKG